MRFACQEGSGRSDPERKTSLKITNSMEKRNYKITARYVTPEEVAKVFPIRPSDSHKGSYGYVALIGGSLENSGAIRLATLADSAMRSGAGVASVAAVRSICPVIAGQILEATLIPLSESDGRIVFRESEFEPIVRRYDTIAFGMGIGNSAETVKAVRYLLENYDKTLIIDADGLNAMSELDHSLIRSSRARLVLTPHLKEFSRLSGMTVAEAKADPCAAACYLADELDAVVLLKGSTTVVAGSSVTGSSGAGASENEIAGNERFVLMTDRGCAGMATAGSGDVLSGILAAVCAMTDDLTLAAAAGAYINGAAGELAMSRRSDVTMTAADTAMCVAEAVEEIIGKGRGH
ncbi:MAG: NAD(P)H-hydrate dehydratase [Clostridiales bacterium]|nr:NAD(P)H-hydrate dehydratase [Clostridiales bacterium]